MAAPISHPQYRAADTIALDNCKIAISTVIVRTVKNTLKKFSQKKCGMNNHTTLDICAFHHVQLANQHMELSKEFKLVQL